MLIQAAQKAVCEEMDELAAFLRTASGEEDVPRQDLLARLGATSLDFSASDAADADEADDEETEAKVDALMEKVQAIMEAAEADGSDPTPQLQEVVGASVVKQIVEGMDRAT